MPAQTIRRCPRCSSEGPFYETCKTAYCKPCWNAYESQRRKKKLASETSEQREARLEQRRLKRHGRSDRVRKPVTYGPEGTKRCNQCEEWKPVGDYHRARHSKDGRASYCKPCAIAQKTAYYQQHRERLIAYQKTRREADLEAARAAERATYRRTAARHKATARARERGMKPLNRPSLDYEAVLRGDPCSYCGGRAEQIDHIVPVAADGENHWTNLTASCWPCNRAKWDKPLLVALAA